MTDHEHVWTAWRKDITMRDSVGAVIPGKAMVATLSGTARPVSSGWSRKCWSCADVDET